MEILNAALELLEQGICALPANGKHPSCSWGHYEDEQTLPSVGELERWWSTNPNWDLCIVTGELSKLIVVDCDNEKARRQAVELGLDRTPIWAKTKNGWHYYWRYPDGAEKIQNRVGANANDMDWPRCKGLDLRAKKGIAVCAPTKGYTWHKACDFDELPDYPYESDIDLIGRSLSNVVTLKDFQFGGVSLSGVKAELNIWEQTKIKVDREGKFQTGGGNGRDDAAYKAMGMGASKGLRGDELREFAYEFMDTFFVERLDESKIDQMLERCEKAEEKKNPTPTPEPVVRKKISPITTHDIERLEQEIGTQEYILDPWLPKTGSICQVHGYSGHGKSMFIRNALYHVAAGAKSFGPWNIDNRSKVLYLDFENSRSNIVTFLEKSRRSIGDAENYFQMFAPFDVEDQMNLMTDAGLMLLSDWIKASKPDVVCVDTIRSAWLGLEENSANQWSQINQMCLDLRNSGITVVLVHHSNKPSESRLGREAGSSNQLTVLETQIKITQVFRDPDTAEARAGISDADLDHSVWDAMDSNSVLRMGERLDVIVEARYGKVRDWTDAHETHHYIGFASSTTDNTHRVVGRQGVKQWALKLATSHMGTDGQRKSALDDREIASKVSRPLEVVQQWTSHLRTADVSNKVTNLQA